MIPSHAHYKSVEIPGEDAESVVVSGPFGRFRLKLSGTLLASVRARLPQIAAPMIAEALFTRWPERVATIAQAARVHEAKGTGTLYVYAVNWSENVRDVIIEATSRLTNNPPIFSIGYGNTPWAELSTLLSDAGINTICDIRSSPYSSRRPELSRAELSRGLRSLGIRYVHLGDELGGRPPRESEYRDGVADYERMAQAPSFVAALDSLLALARRERVALLCAETDPACCHRALLVGRRLGERGMQVMHLLHDGRRESQTELESRIVAALGLAPDPLFATPADFVSAIEAAYQEQGSRVAFRLPDVDTKHASGSGR